MRTVARRRVMGSLLFGASFLVEAEAEDVDCEKEE